MSFKELARDDKLDISMSPGDVLELGHTRTYTDSRGNVIRTTEEVVLREEIKEPLHINSVVLFEFEDEFGMKRGVGGAFGKKEE